MYLQVLIPIFIIILTILIIVFFVKKDDRINNLNKQLTDIKKSVKDYRDLKNQVIGNVNCDSLVNSANLEKNRIKNEVDTMNQTNNTTYNTIESQLITLAKDFYVITASIDATDLQWLKTQGGFVDTIANCQNSNSCFTNVATTIEAFIKKLQDTITSFSAALQKLINFLQTEVANLVIGTEATCSTQLSPIKVEIETFKAELEKEKKRKDDYTKITTAIQGIKLPTISNLTLNNINALKDTLTVLNNAKELNMTTLNAKLNPISLYTVYSLLSLEMIFSLNATLSAFKLNTIKQTDNSNSNYNTGAAYTLNSAIFISENETTLANITLAFSNNIYNGNVVFIINNSNKDINVEGQTVIVKKTFAAYMYNAEKKSRFERIYSNNVANDLNLKNTQIISSFRVKEIVNVLKELYGPKYITYLMGF